MAHLSPATIEAIERSADPVAARIAIERIVDTHPDVVTLLSDSATLAAFVAVVAASRSLTNALIVDPEAVRVLTRLATAPRLSRRKSLDHAAELRRWKRRALLRLAARDLTGLATMPEVGRELASLASRCLERALELAAPTIPVAIIGMGKLGGGELNYSSDVDVMFVHADTDSAADVEGARVARHVLATMTTTTADGIVFRTDADLRPQGRAGPLSMTLRGYREYWQRDADGWEFQALLKARPVAGDPELGEQFMIASRAPIWSQSLGPDAIREIRAMKATAEEQLVERGIIDRELKRGRGGIRDIEFAVQLLQLVHGRHDEGLRSANTLEALDQLAGAGYVDPADAETMSRAYLFLRNAEHRLQLYDERQTHTLPDDDEARDRLARTMGFRDTGDATALDQFDAELRVHQHQARQVHEKLFFRPALEAFAGSGPMSVEAADERLQALGFRDSAATRSAMHELAAGLTRKSRLMQQLFPLLLEWLADSPDPDLGLLQLRLVAEGGTRSQALVNTFRDSPVAAERACALLGSSRVIGQAMRRHPDFVGGLADDAAMESGKSPRELLDEARAAVTLANDDDLRRLARIRRFTRRELLRIAARDRLGFADLREVERELTSLADATVQAAVEALAPPFPLAVIGLGRYGGGELSYASDLDVLFVHDDADVGEAERYVTRVVKMMSDPTAEGRAWSVDIDLRPEGRAGTMSRTVPAFVDYWEHWAETWERQAMIKARFVAGDMNLGTRWLDALAPIVWREPLPLDATRDIRRMKARIENERIPPGEDPQFHLKLGPGSISDVEFTVQLLQLELGGTTEDVRSGATLDALDALVSRGRVSVDDAAAMRESYVFCSRVRNAVYLHRGLGANSLPTEGDDLVHVARMLGYTTRVQSALRDDYRRVTRRGRQVVERLFYGRTT